MLGLVEAVESQTKFYFLGSFEAKPQDWECGANKGCTAYLLKQKDFEKGFVRNKNMTSFMETAGQIASSVDEKRTIHKCQWRLLPFLFLCYSVALLDRANIGFAALTMNKDLGLTAQAFGFIGGIFFLGYVVCEIPSNVMLHRFGARIWIARVLISWGIVAALTGFAQNVTQLCVVRFMLGVAEAGFYPGILLYCTYWFRRKERAQSIAVFMAAQPFFAIIGGPISGLILDHIHWLGIPSWRWLLILEAAPAVVMGLACYIMLPDRPKNAKFLSPAEKDWLNTQIEAEQKFALNETGHASGWRVLGNLRVWHLAIAAMIFTNATIWMNFWLPSLIKVLSKSHTATNVGMLVAIPMICGLIAMQLISRHSDKTQERRYHIAIPNILGGIALLLLFMGHGTHPFLLSMVFLTLMVIGIDNFYGIFWSLPSKFLTGYAAASGIALISTVANLTGFVGPWFIGWVNGKTGGLYAGAAIVGGCLIVSSLLLLLFNDKRRTEV